MSEVIYNQRFKNTNSFNSIYLTFFKNNNVKIEIKHSYFTKNGFLESEWINSKTTKDKIEDFLKNCDSFYESLYRFTDYQDFLKFKKTFINN